jgi:Nucleotide modification associated domain 2
MSPGRYISLSSSAQKWAKAGSWVVGIGGTKTHRPNKLIHAMRVDENLSYSEFRKKYPNQPDYVGEKINGSGRRSKAADDREIHAEDARVLVSRHFYYFGHRAKPLPPELAHLIHPTQGCKRLTNGDIELLNKRVLRGRAFGRYGKPNNSPEPRCNRQNSIAQSKCNPSLVNRLFDINPHHVG